MFTDSGLLKWKLKKKKKCEFFLSHIWAQKIHDEFLSAIISVFLKSLLFVPTYTKPINFSYISG